MMNNMKKAAAVLAVVLGICPLSSCGGTESSKKSESSKIAEEEEIQPITSKDKSIAIENDDSEDEEEDTTAEPETEAPEKSNDTAEASDLKLGEVSGNVYTSEFNGLKITVPTGFEIVNGDELDELIDRGASLTNMESAMDAINSVTINDAAILNTLNGANISIAYEDLAKTVPNPEDYTVEEYLEISKKSVAGIGMDIDMGEVSKTELGGQEFYTRCQTYNMPDYNLEMDMQIFVRKIGNYMLVINYTGPIRDEDAPFDTYRSWFSSLN